MESGNEQSVEGAAERAKALSYYEAAERAASEVPDVPSDTPQRPVRKVGIIGAGTMGGGIAMSFANAGIPVIIVERDQAALERGLAVVRKNYERSVQKGRFTSAELEARVARIEGALQLEKLSDCDLVIEAVFENMGVKQELFARLDAICKKGAILASNTSALDINQIAAATKRPSDVIGMHFFSPANVMKLLEAVRGQQTAHDVISTVMALGKTIGKVPALVGVCPGFVANRIMGRRGPQLQKVLLQGAPPWEIDRVLTDYGFPMGPFATADLAGLDIGWIAEKSRGQSIRDRLCEMGRRGQKSGAGYYNYDPETRARSPEPKVAELIANFAREKGMTQREFSDQEIIERCVLAVINEGAKIVQEGVVIRPSDIDVIVVNGYSWPKYRGGPMYHADKMGIPNVVSALQRFAQQDDDPQWQPAELLTRMAAEGRTFTQALASH
jgi:3-hydroxyacyl-CoA dehydrogenase